MQFEHLVQVNDLANPTLPILSRQQVWQGLVLRARLPDEFVLGLEDFTLNWLSDGRLQRSLALPGMQVQDLVTFVWQESVHYDIVKTDSQPGGSLLMSLEEPQPDDLFVRFRYEVHYVDALGSDQPYEQLIQQAYHKADLDTVSTIRRLVIENPGGVLSLAQLPQ